MISPLGVTYMGCSLGYTRLQPGWQRVAGLPRLGLRVEQCLTQRLLALQVPLRLLGHRSLARGAHGLAHRRAAHTRRARRRARARRRMRAEARHLLLGGLEPAVRLLQLAPQPQLLAALHERGASRRVRRRRARRAHRRLLELGALALRRARRRDGALELRLHTEQRGVRLGERRLQRDVAEI